MIKHKTEANHNTPAIIGPYELCLPVLIFVLLCRVALHLWMRWRRARKYRSSTLFMDCNRAVALIIAMETYDYFDPLPGVFNQAYELAKKFDSFGFQRVSVLNDPSRAELVNLKKYLLPSIGGRDNSLILVYYIGRSGPFGPTQISTLLPKDAATPMSGIDANTFLQYLSPYGLPQNLLAPETKVVLFLDFRGGPNVPDTGFQKHVGPCRLNAPTPFYIVSRSPEALDDDKSSFYKTFLRKVESHLSLDHLVDVIRHNAESELVVMSSASFPGQEVSLALPRGGLHTDASSLSGMSDTTDENMGHDTTNITIYDYVPLI